MEKNGGETSVIPPGVFGFRFARRFANLPTVRVAKVLYFVFWLVVAGGADAREIFLGGKDFLLAREISSPGREVQVFYPYGSGGRDWQERIEIHHYPALRQPRRVVMEVIDRLRARYPEFAYKVLPGPEKGRAGLTYLASTEGRTEVRLEYLLYTETKEAPGLMAYRFTLRSVGPDALYSRSLLRGKQDYYERAFMEVDWPPSLESAAAPAAPGVFGMGRGSLGDRLAAEEAVESRSLTVRSPEGRVLRVDRAFLEARGIDRRPPFFSFTAPADTENLYIEYQSPGVPEILKLSLAGPEMQLAENLRVFPFIVPGGEGNERLWHTAGKLRRKVEEEYLQGWEDVRVNEPFLTRIGLIEAFVCLASFADPDGNRMFARFTLLLPESGDRGLLAFSQIDPRFSAVKRIEDLESGGVMTPVAHSIRFLDPDGRTGGNPSPLPYERD